MSKSSTILHQKWQWAVLNDHTAIVDLMVAWYRTHLNTPIKLKHRTVSIWCMEMRCSENVMVSFSISHPSHVSEPAFPMALMKTSRSVIEQLFAKSYVNGDNIEPREDPHLRENPLGKLLNFLVKYCDVQLAVKVMGVHFPHDFPIFREVNLDTTWTVAVESGLDILRALLRIPEVDLGSTDEDGYTALALTVKRGHTEMVELLFRAQDDRSHVQHPAWRSEEGETLIHMATQRRNTDILRIPLDRQRFTVNWEDRFGETPLIVAILRNRVDVVDLLLRCPNIDARSVALCGLAR